MRRVLGGRPGRRREYKRLMELKPKKWSCPWAKEGQDWETQSRGGLQSPGKSESSHHNALMLEQKACPCLSCQELKKAPEALGKRGHHSHPPYASCPSPSLLKTDPAVPQPRPEGQSRASTKRPLGIGGLTQWLVPHCQSGAGRTRWGSWQKHRGPSRKHSWRTSARLIYS